MSDTAPATGFGEWSVENLRLSVFCTGKPAQPGLWGRLVGVSPESSDTREHEGTVREQGMVDANTLLLVSRNERLDWILLPRPGPGDSNRGNPIVLENVERAISLLTRALDVSIGAFAFGRADRIAFGSVLVQRAFNPTDAAKQLSRYLPRLDLGLDGSDFLYQINRRRRSSHALHVQINRLSRWQLEDVRGGLLTIGPLQPPGFTSDEQFSISKLTLDVNTAPGNNAISNERMPGLLDEMIAFSYEIAANGDIP